MSSHNSKPVLRATVRKLMPRHYGIVNLNRLARECKFTLSTAARIKAQETSIGLEVVDRLADYFRIEPGQLLMNDFDPEQAATLRASPMAVALAQMLDAIPNPEKKQRAYTLMAQVAELCGTQG